VRLMDAEQERIFLTQLRPQLAAERLAIVGWSDLDETERKRMTAIYDERIFPVLTPLAVDPSHPFPYISDLALSIATIVRDPATGDTRFARVKVPDRLPRLITVDAGRYLLAEELVIAHLDSLFSGMVIDEAAPFLERG